MLRRGGRPAWERVDRPLAVALAIGAALTIVTTTTPLLRFAYDNLLLHVALETAEGLSGALLAYLASERYRARGTPADAALAWTFGLLAATNIGLSALPMVTAGARPGGTLLWAVMGLRLAGAAGLCVAAFTDTGSVLSSGTVRRRLVGATLAVAVLVAVGSVAATAWLSDAVDPSLRAAASGRPRLFGHPVTIAAQIGATVLFGAAAGGFRRRARASGEELLRWLTAGAVLAAFARLNFVLFPSLYTNWVYTGDVLRLASYVFFLVGAGREIAAYRHSQTRLAVLDERRRMARDLHDGLVQELSFIRSQTAAMAQGARTPDLTEHVAAAAERALRESRRAVEALSSVSADDPTDVLRVAAGEIADRAGTAVHVSVEGVPVLSSDVRNAVARIVREATSNAVRHGQASSVTVSLRASSSVLVLVVTDDGKGFDLNLRSTEGFGLTSMRERAEGLGGGLVMWSEPGRGTKVEVPLPVG